MLSTYLTESLLHELERVKSQVSYNDLVTCTRELNAATKANYAEGLAICDKVATLI